MNLFLTFFKKYLFQTFSVGAIFLFLLSNIFQPNLWSIKQANAISNGVGASLTPNNDGSSWTIRVSYDGTVGKYKAGDQIAANFKVFHCRQATNDICIPNGSADYMEETASQTVNFTVPPANSPDVIIGSFSARAVSCGRLQADLGVPGEDVFGGSKFKDSWADCAPAPTPVPTPVPTPIPTPTATSAPTCIYGSTQARWQRNTSDPWVQNKTISQGESANVGSFHDNTGQFAKDTTLNVTGPGTNINLINGQTFIPQSTGTYQLKVTTNNQSGPACEGTATLTVNPTQVQCTWISTQARVQRNLSDPWDTFKTIKSGEQIRVGGFHNNIDRFATDVNLNVSGPMSFSNLGNGDFITPTTVGSYSLTVTSIGQSGPSCEDRASFQVQAVATPTPSGSPTPTQTPTPTPPGGGITITNNNTNINANTNTSTNTNNNTNTSSSSSSSSSTSSVTNNITFGNVGVGATVVSGQVLGVKELPKTGLPVLAWSALAFLPAGLRLRKFKTVKKDLADDPHFIWEDRQFKAS